MKKLKYISFIALSLSFVTAISATAFAKNTTVKIPASYKDIKIVVDGIQLQTSSEPFIYNGTTYLPVRAVAEAVGKDVNWDGNTNTVYLGSYYGGSNSGVIGSMPDTTTYTPPVQAPSVSPQLTSSDYSAYLYVEEYSYTNSLDDTVYAQYITNNSSQTLTITANVTAKDRYGNIVGAKSNTEYAVAGSSSVIMTYYFDGDEIDHFEYSLSADASSSYFKSASQDIAHTVSDTRDKLIVSCTNTGYETAEFVRVEALFFRRGELVYSNSTYCVDSDSELKPGNTIVKEINCYEDFDDYKIAITARR